MSELDDLNLTAEEAKLVKDVMTTPLDNVFKAHHEAEVVMRGVTPKEYDRMVRKIRKRGAPWIHNFEWTMLPDSEKRFFYRLDNLFLQLLATFIILHSLVFGAKFPGIIAWFSIWTINVGGALAALATILAVYMEYVAHRKLGIDEANRDD